MQCISTQINFLNEILLKFKRQCLILHKSHTKVYDCKKLYTLISLYLVYQRNEMEKRYNIWPK